MAMAAVLIQGEIFVDKHVYKLNYSGGRSRADEEGSHRHGVYTSTKTGN